MSNGFHTYTFKTITQVLISEKWFFLYESTWPYSKGLNNLKPNPNILFHVKQNVWTWPKMKLWVFVWPLFFFPFFFGNLKSQRGKPFESTPALILWFCHQNEIKQTLIVQSSTGLYLQTKPKPRPNPGVLSNTGKPVDSPGSMVLLT